MNESTPPLSWYHRNQDYCRKQNNIFYHENNYKLYHREYYRRNKERINCLKKLRLKTLKYNEVNKLQEAIKADLNNRDIDFELNIGEQQFFI